jgi:hypothetical protein
MSDDGGSVIDHQFVELPTVVPDGLRLVRSPGDYSPWVSVDEFLVKPLGLTNAYDTPQSYIQLQLFLLAFPDTFIIYNNIGEDMQLHGTWRVVRQRPPDRGYFIICNRIGEVHPRQSDEALGVMESILSRGTEDIPEVDIGSESQRDEDREQSRTDASDEDYEVSWQDVWSQQAASEILRTVHDVPMVGQLGHFRTRQQIRERFSWEDLEDDVMRHMGACSVCQHHESGHDSLATLVSGQSWESMLASLNPGVLELYSRDDIIGVLPEYGTPQEAVWVDREAEFSDHGQDNIAISTLRPEVYSSVGIEILGMAPSELCDAGFGALLERMGVSGTCMIGSFHCWGNLRADRDEDAMWQDGSPWLRIRYISRSSSWLAGDLDSIGGGSWEIGLGERLLDGWILYLLVPLVGGLQETLGVDVSQDYTLQGTAVHILIWDPGIRVFGSPVVDGVEIRAERLLEELTEDLLHMIALLIRSIWGPAW